MTDDTRSEPTRELAHRAADGVDVELLWSETENRLGVRVTETRSGSCFELDAPADRALDVFHHPYAYAAQQGVACREHAGKATCQPQFDAVLLKGF